MNIALLTIWHIGNYGAELQTYCTVKALEQLGHKVKVIRYDLKDNPFKTDYTLKQRIYGYISSLMPAHIKAYYFWKKHIPSTRKYNSCSDLVNLPPDADAYVVGSDQVWNTTITHNSAHLYFLCFGKEEVRRISYASSFGASKWLGDNEITNLASTQLKKFHAISCREQSGVKILKNIFGVDAECVLDPTLLVDSFSELTGNLVDNNTLVYYPLSPNPEVEKFCIQLSNEIGLEYKLANKRTFLRKSLIWNKPSVPEWLKCIGEAKFVITPSFHGLTTSIKQHRNFAVIITESLIMQRSARIIDLLELLGLSNRLFTSVEELYESKIWETPIDYSIIDNKLSKLREKSLLYLKNSLL